MTQSLFNHDYLRLNMHLLDPAYIPALGIGGWWTMLMLNLHPIWSIATPIALTEALVPQRAQVAWLRRTGYIVTALMHARELWRILCGPGRRSSNVTAETAEAGLFQTSYNARFGSPLMVALISQYAGASLFLDLFREGVKCKAFDLKNYGEGEGREFQRLTKGLSSICH